LITRFRDLIAPLAERDFFAAMDGKTRVVLPPTAAREASSLLPWAALEGLMSSPLLPRDQVQVRVNGKAVSDVMLGLGDARKRTDAIRRFASLGASLVVNGIDDYVEPIARLSESIERRTERRVHVNCYAGLGQSGAFSPHYDTHDVLVVQLQGSKRWRGFGVDVPDPVRWLPAASADVRWEATLDPGSLIYLPRGEVHDAQVESSPSLHLTFGLTALTGLDFLAWMARRAEHDEELRRDLTVAGEGTRAAIDSAHLKRRLHDLVDRISIDEFLHHHGRRQDTARRGRPQQFGLAFRARLHPDAWVVPVSRRRGWMHIEGQEEPVPTERIMARLSSHARAMLALILDEDGLQVRELALRLDLTIADPAFVDALDELAGLGLCGVRE
jgi:hypothetical protein